MTSHVIIKGFLMQPPNGYIPHLAYMAFATGQGKNTNPYRGVRREWAKAWDDGFDAAKAEENRANWTFTPAMLITTESSGDGSEVRYWRAMAECVVGHATVFGTGKTPAEAEATLRANLEERVRMDRRVDAP